MIHVELERYVKVTPHRVSKFKNPSVVLWHAASPPEYQVCLNKDERYWVRSYAHSATNVLKAAVHLCYTLWKTLNIPLENFKVCGSSVLTTEWLLKELRSLEGSRPLGRTQQ